MQRRLAGLVLIRFSSLFWGGGFLHFLSSLLTSPFSSSSHRYFLFGGVPSLFFLLHVVKVNDIGRFV
jgi:hypothetical protein